MAEDGVVACCLLCILDDQLVDDQSVEKLACSDVSVHNICIYGEGVAALESTIHPLTWCDITYKAACLHHSGLSHLPVAHANYHHPEIVSTGQEQYDVGFEGGIQRGNLYVFMESARRFYQQTNTLINGVMSNFRRGFVTGQKFAEIETSQARGAVLINMHDDLTAWPQSKYVDVKQLTPNEGRANVTEEQVTDLMNALKTNTRPTTLIVVDNLQSFMGGNQDWQLHQVVEMWMNKFRANFDLSSVAIILIADNAKYQCNDLTPLRQTAVRDKYQLTTVEMNVDYELDEEE